MQSTQIVRLAAFVLIVWSKCAAAAVSTASGTLSCDRVALGSQSTTKWTVRCITDRLAPSVSSAYFNPSFVENYYVDSGAYAAASNADLNLSASFSEIDTLVSSSVTTFSLLAASEFIPDVPVTIVPSAFAELSVLQTLHLEGIPLATSALHLKLPTSIQKISIVNCGLSNFSFEFADGSKLADSDIMFIDLQQNALVELPSFLYELPSGVATIDLRRNALDLSTETDVHKKQLTEWINTEKLLVDSKVLQPLSSSSQEERNSTVDATNVAPKHNDTESGKGSVTSSSRSEENVTAQRKETSDMDVIPITILAIVIPAVLAVGVTLAFVIRKRRRMQERESEAILSLPHPFNKSSRDRFETSGHFTAIESELSRSRMSSGEGHQAVEERGSIVNVSVSPADTEQCHHISTSASVGYINLESPHEIPQSLSMMTNMKRQVARREDSDSIHSLELFSTHSTASATTTQARIAARIILRSALETLLTTRTNAAGHCTAPLLTVNAYQYTFNPDTRIEETPFAFYIDCRLAGRISEDIVCEPAPLGQLVLKVFIEDDADLAGRESYALSSLQHDDFSRGFAPRLIDDALEYELDLGTSTDAGKLSCCILVLDKPSCTSLCTYLTASSEPLEQSISRVVNALRALHARGLVHGALDTDSLVACSPDGRLKFWGLEHASRTGHTMPCSDADLLGLCQAECIAPELAALALEETPSSRTSPSLDVWSLGVLILKLYAAGCQLQEFTGCGTPRDVFKRLRADELDGELASSSFFERSITRFVLNEDMKNLLRQCLVRNSTLRPSIESIATYKLFQTKEREVSRTTTVRSGVVTRMLSAIIEEKDVVTSRGLNDVPSSGEPEREASGKEQTSDKVSELMDELVDTPESLPPSLWLFLPPVELPVDLTPSLYSIEQWVAKLHRLQQQHAEELRFPLVFMCESCEADAAVPCTIVTKTTTKYGVSVSSSLLPLVMPLVRETMLFLEARAILSDGLSVGEVCGLEGPQQWEELRTFYSALELMELATVNPVNELELTPMELQLKSRDRVKAHEVLDKLTGLIFSEDKREYVRSLLDALVTDQDLMVRAERSSWAALSRCEVACESSSTRNRTRWLCSHHAPQES